MMKRLLVAMAATASIGSTASAHFVWIESQPGDAGLLIRSGFGEPDGWDPDLVDRMGKSTFRLRYGSELKPTTLPLHDGEKEYRADVSGPAPDAVLGTTDFGVIQFGGNPPSWLRYTAKHLVGTPDAWHDDQPTKDLRIEVLARRDGDRVVLKVLHLGKPAVGAVIKTFPAEGDSATLTTDASGEAVWEAKAAGTYACYVGVTTPEPGDVDGKKYDALKDYATLTFRLP